MTRHTAGRLAWYLVALGVTCFLLVGTERAGRSFPMVMRPQWQIESFSKPFYSGKYAVKFVADDDIGFLMPPNLREVREHGYTYQVETDGKGFPNRDPWPRHPTIVFLGDSLVGGAGVGLAKSFPRLAVQRLAGETMVNLALGGAGPERQIAIYRKFGVGLHPRTVVACLYLGSDFDNDLHFHSWRLQGRSTDYNTFRLTFAAAQHERGWIQRQLSRSWLLGMTEETVLTRVEGSQYLSPRHRFADGSEMLFDEHALHFAAAPASPHDARIGALMMSLERLRRLVEQDGATLLIVLIPSKEELFGVPAASASTNVVARTRERVRQSTLAVLDLYPVIQRSTAEAPYFREDIHLTEYGNRVVAAKLAAWLSGGARGPFHADATLADR
jgi:SGNH hydrolase-like domain, acetyltransferase AlgX